jgi:hypothetical protein
MNFQSIQIYSYSTGIRRTKQRILHMGALQPDRCPERDAGAAGE